MQAGAGRNRGTCAMRAGQATHPGLLRPSNEDALLTVDLSQAVGRIGKPAALFAVADGMGGCQQGEVASSLGLGAFRDCVLAGLNALKATAVRTRPGRERIQRVLADAVQAANLEVLARRTALRNDMGTTLVALLVLGNTACVVNVGDSRAYLLRGGKLERLTVDHSLVAVMVSSEIISPDEVYTHPQRNVITRCIGADTDVEADCFHRVVEPGDVMLLCSDGLWEMVRDPEIAQVLLNTPDPQRAADDLVSRANRNGGADNVSVTVVDFVSQLFPGTGVTASGS